MRIYLQQFENGNHKYFTNVPINVVGKENSKFFKKLYVNFKDTKDKDGNVIKTCEPTTGNITPTRIALSGYYRAEEKQMKDKVTGADVAVDVRQTEIVLQIYEYTKSEIDIAKDTEDMNNGKDYVKPPYNAEQIAKNKLNAYNKRKSQQESESSETFDPNFISLPEDNLGEILPF